MYLRFRRWIWRRLGIPLPGLPGWEKIVCDVAACGDGVWKGDGGVVGAPLAWSLLVRNATDIVPVDAICAWSDRVISGATPFVDGEPDISSWGVRCARCGVPIHVQHAGMIHAFSIPSCPPCRSRVRAAALRLG